MSKYLKDVKNLGKWITPERAFLAEDTANLTVLRQGYYGKVCEIRMRLLWQKQSEQERD